MTIAIKTEGLTKTFRIPGGPEVMAVDHLDLEVPEGEIFGFLGPNGAGKTTTIKMLLGLIFPTEGKASVLGKPIGDREVRKEISYLPESPYFYEHLTAPAILDFYGQLFGIPVRERRKRVEQLIERVGLTRAKSKPLRQFSKGMLQRVGIAQALINEPKLLIFDEPTSGLDPEAHMEIRELILSLKGEGKTVFLSSHQLYDVELVCDRVAIIVDGKLRKLGDLNAMRADERTRLVAQVPAGAQEAIRRIVPDAEFHNGSVTLYHRDHEALGEVIDIIRQNKGRLIELVPQRRSLEEIFRETIKEAR